MIPSKARWQKRIMDRSPLQAYRSDCAQVSLKLAYDEAKELFEEPTDEDR